MTSFSEIMYGLLSTEPAIGPIADSDVVLETREGTFDLPEGVGYFYVGSRCGGWYGRARIIERGGSRHLAWLTVVQRLTDHTK